MSHRWAHPGGRYDRNQAAKLRGVMSRYQVTATQLAGALKLPPEMIESAMEYAKNPEEAAFTDLMVNGAEVWIKQGRFPDILAVAKHWAGQI